MPYQDLKLEKEEGIATLTLNRPEKLNAISPAMSVGLRQVVEEVHRDDAIRVLVITGAGRGFCSGADVERQAARIAGEVAEVSRRDTLSIIGERTLTFAKLEKPIIAAVNGVVAGAGLALALVCDIRIASEAARFTAVWVKRGLIPDCGATYLLPQLIGMSKALELMYTGDIIDAREAEQIGLVSKVVPAEELMSATKELAARIAKGPSIPIELIRRGAYRPIVVELERQLLFETYGQRICRQTEDHREGVRSFMEKREPHFKGF